MKKYKKCSELTGYRDWAHELAVEIVFNVFIAEHEYPTDENCCVLLIERDEDIAEIQKAFPYLTGKIAEIDEITACANKERFRKIVYILDDTGAGIVIFQRQ